MMCDPSWKTDNNFRSNYMSQVMWLKTKFIVISDMLKYSECQWNDADNTMACERDCAVVEGFKDAFHNMENEQNGKSGGDNVCRFYFSLSYDEERFNANFGTMANVVVDAMTDDNNNKKAKSKQLKDLINELMKPNILSGNVLYAAEIFETNKDKLDLSLNLSHHMPMSYVHKLTSLPLGFLHLVSSMLLVGIVFVATLGLEFVLGFAPLESSLSQLVLVSAPLGLHLVSALVHVESVVVHLESALVHLTIQTI
ncbi:hypothetical protein Tco_0798215 [Tanacetum coccineum]